MGWKRGDVIMTSEPYVHVLLHKHRLERCSYCLMKRESIKKCTGCSVLRYCSRNCQRRDWGLHKTECPGLKAVSPNVPTDSVLLMLRLVIRFMQGDHTKTMEGDPGLRTFEQLMSHKDEVKQDAERCDAFSKLTFTLSQLTAPYLTLPDPADLLDMFGKMVINTFTIADEELQDIGSGIYLSPSSLDHRCEATGVVTFSGKTLTLRAVEDIPEGDLTTVSERVFLSYVDQLAPSSERQQQLQQQYYFTCRCARCQDTSLDQAMTSGTAYDHCEQASGLAETEDFGVLEAISNCQTVIARVDQLKKAPDSDSEILSLCGECLCKVTPVLPPLNVYLLRVLDRAFDAAICTASWEEALGYGLRTLKPYRELLPAHSPNLGLQLLRVAKLQLWLNQAAEAFSLLSQAEAIIGVTHGQDGSELYSQLRELLSQAREEMSAGYQQRVAINMS